MGPSATPRAAYSPFTPPLPTPWLRLPGAVFLSSYSRDQVTRNHASDLQLLPAPEVTSPARAVTLGGLQAGTSRGTGLLCSPHFASGPDYTHGRNGPFPRGAMPQGQFYRGTGGTSSLQQLSLIQPSCKNNPVPTAKARQGSRQC